MRELLELFLPYQRRGLVTMFEDDSDGAIKYCWRVTPSICTRVLGRSILIGVIRRHLRETLHEKVIEVSYISTAMRSADEHTKNRLPETAVEINKALPNE